MNYLYDRILRLKIWKDNKGQDLVEYALAVGMVAVAAVAAMPTLSTAIGTLFSKVTTAMGAVNP